MHGLSNRVLGIVSTMQLGALLDAKVLLLLAVDGTITNTLAARAAALPRALGAAARAEHHEDAMIDAFAARRVAADGVAGGATPVGAAQQDSSTEDLLNNKLN